MTKAQVQTKGSQSAAVATPIAKAGTAAGGLPADRIPLTKPFITQAVKDRISKTLDSGWITEGPVTKEFEGLFASWLGCRNAIAVTSCTTGLEAALRALKIGPGDEVIVPDFTYPCTASMVALVGATAVLVDICRDTMLIDYDLLEAAITKRTRAIMPVSLFGNPLDYKRLRQIADRHKLPIIEDAACSVGSAFDGVPVGRLADITVFSLHPRKVITTGEGGVITTENQELNEWLRSYKNFGVKAKDGKYTFELFGTNLKVSDILSAVGVVMMENLADILQSRRKYAAAYTERLKDVAGVRLPIVTPGGVHSWQSFPIFVEDRDKKIIQMREMGVETQFGTHALHRYNAFQNQPLCRLEGAMPNATYAWEHCLVLPLFHGMTDETVERVVASLKRVL